MLVTNPTTKDQMDVKKENFIPQRITKRSMLTLKHLTVSFKLTVTKSKQKQLCVLNHFNETLKTETRTEEIAP